MRDGVDHAPDLRAVLLDDGVMHPLETEGAQRLLLVLLVADARLGLGDLQASHGGQLPCPARARSMPAGATSSRGRPRRAATCSRRASGLNAAPGPGAVVFGVFRPRGLGQTAWAPPPPGAGGPGP